jgi:hypothetical protein
MKTALPIILILFIGFAASAQTNLQIDSVVNLMCFELENTKHLTDSARMNRVVNLVAPSFDKKFVSSKNGENNSVLKVILRLSFRCLEVYDMMAKHSPQPPHCEMLTIKKKTNLKDRESKKILNGKFYFLQSVTDTVQLSLKDGLWFETFKDGSFSKLRLTWKGNSEFEIEFIESNNMVKKSFSNPGDKYRYTVLDKTPDAYIISAEFFKDLRYQTFKIFPK